MPAQRRDSLTEMGAPAPGNNFPHAFSGPAPRPSLAQCLRAQTRVAGLERGSGGSPGCRLGAQRGQSPFLPGGHSAPCGGARHRDKPWYAHPRALHPQALRGIRSGGFSCSIAAPSEDHKCPGDSSARADAWFSNPPSRDAALALLSTVTQPLVWAVSSRLHYYYHDKDQLFFCWFFFQLPFSSLYLLLTFLNSSLKP